ncbi:MAG TPA: sodium-dependent transporter [Campylobacterales bacterium]|nr:sodium-dependent transporter [Campylobacterales bacterium]
MKAHFSKIGFVLAAAGSAIGLGNIWKFPYIAGEYGGGAFVLAYIVAVILVGIPLLMGEMAIGAIAKKDPVGSFEALSARFPRFWKNAGFSMLTGLVILSFYSIVIGWILYYIFLTLSFLPSSVDEAKSVFETLLLVDVKTQILFHTISMIITVYIVVLGVEKGIERANLILLPLLFAILFFLFFYSMSFDSFWLSIEFMFTPNFEQLTPKALLVAVGHAFFTLSLGMATMLTYASYASKDTNYVKTAVIVSVMEIFVAIFVSITLFAFLLNFGFETKQGPGLVFVTMPALFYNFGFFGNILALLFFIALAFASITSAISILEPTAAYLIAKGWSRKKAVIVFGAIVWAVGVALTLSNTTEYSKALSFESKSLFDWFDFVSSAVLMIAGGIVTALFIGFGMDKNFLKTHVTLYMPPLVFEFWYIAVKYFIPALLTGLMVYMVGAS